jgi:hypothetical protein
MTRSVIVALVITLISLIENTCIKAYQPGVGRHNHDLLRRTPSQSSLHCRRSPLQSTPYIAKEESIIDNEGIMDTIVANDSFISSSSAKKNLSRRRSFIKSIVTSSCATAITMLSHQKQAIAATKAKGAAEYDFEFYMRDLFQGNTKQGNILPSQPPPSPPSRTLSLSFIRPILNDSCDEKCLAIRELSSLVNVSPQEISNKIITFREKVSKVYQTKAPWKVESIGDEYYFDLTCYALYRIAAELIPTDYALRDTWVRNVGRDIYNLMKEQSYVTGVVQSSSLSSKAKLTSTILQLQQILDTFQNTGFIKSYRLGEKNDDVRTGSNIFDEYDNDDLDSGLNVNLLVSIIRPATLGSALQITGEGSRFSADWISPTISAMFEDILNLKKKVEYESYFVDEEYRPNPKDFFPDEQLLQFTLRK